MMTIFVKASPLLLISAIASFAAPPAPVAAAPKNTAPIAITGGKLLTVSHGAIENGVLVIVDGKIAAVGEAGKVSIPKDATMVDRKSVV